MSLLFFVIGEHKTSSHMAHIRDNINHWNHKTHSCDQTSKIIFNLCSKKCQKNDTSTCQLARLQNFLLISIVDTPEKDLSNVDSEIRHDKSAYIFSKFIINIIFVQYVQSIIYLIFLNDNVSCWSHIFLGWVHQFFKINITTIYFPKNNQWIIWLIKTPSCNTEP